MKKNDFLYEKRGLIGFILIGLFGVFLSVSVGGVMRLWLENEEAAYHSQWGKAMGGEIKGEILSATEVMHTLKNVILASSDFSEVNFEVFVSTTLVRFPSLKRIHWISGGVDEDGEGRYKVMMSHPTNDERFAEKNVLNLPGMQGFLTAASQNRRLLMRPVSSSLLAFDKGDEKSYWAALSIERLYEGADVPVKGVVLGQFDFGDYIDHLLKSRITQIDRLQLVDTTGSHDKVLYQKNWEPPKNNQDMTTSTFTVAGRAMELSFQATHHQQYFFIWAGVSFLGMLVTLMVLVVLIQHRQYQYGLEDSIYRKTRDLTDRNLFLNHFMNVTFDAVVTLDKGCFITFGNQKALGLFDKSEAEFIGHHLAELMGSRIFDQLIFPLSYRHSKDTDPFAEPQIIELAQKQAPSVLVEVRIVAVADLDDKSWMVILRDISKQKETEERLRYTDRQFRQAFLLGAVPMAIIDAEAYVQESNRAMQQLLGYRSSELHTRHIKEFLHPDVRDAFLDWLDGVRHRPMDTFQCEQRMIAGNGADLWLMSSYTAIYNKAGKLEKIICQYLDYTQRKKAEDELKDHHDKLAQLVEERTREVQDTRESLIASINAADNAILVYDNQHRLEFSSGQVKNFFPEMAPELRPGASVERLIELQSLRTGEDEIERQRRLAHIHAGISGDEIQLTDGRWIQTRRRKTPSGGTIVVHTDVTSFKDQQELLKRQAEDLAFALQRQQEVNEQQKIFVSVVSHEFKNPLAIIDSAAQRLLRRKGKLDDEDAVKRLHGIRDGVRRLLKLIENTIATQRIENRKLEFKPQKINVSAVIKKVCDKQREIVKDHPICLMDIPDEIEAPIDPELFEIALSNLISNAAKYSPKRTNIDVTMTQDDDFVTIGVADHGIGILDEDVPHIYNRFYRAQGVMDVEGTGLGLSIVKQIVEIHKGEILCENREEQGTRFYMCLPCDERLSEVAD
ncbi:MAG: PAS domain S-box protein [Methylocystaceae bacterium]|nr:PAS domain S-box protein [Methylocystaceae bacterium]